MPVPLLLAAAPGLIKAGASLFGGGKRRRAEAAAKQRQQAASSALQDFQFSNPYANLENTAEDLTVNQQATNVQAQQTDAALAQGLDSIVAGGGGAGGAQAIANAALQSKQGISADIAGQEQSNQALVAQQAASNQQLEAQGAQNLQQQQFGQTQQQFNLAQQDLSQAQQARANATNQLVGGIADTIGSVGGGIADGSIKNPFKRLKSPYDSPLNREKKQLTSKQKLEALKKYGFRESGDGIYSKGGTKYRVNARGEFVTGSGAIDKRGQALADKYYGQFEEEMFEREQRALGNRPTDISGASDQYKDIATQQALAAGVDPLTATRDVYRRDLADQERVAQGGVAQHSLSASPINRMKSPLYRTLKKKYNKM